MPLLNFLFRIQIMNKRQSKTDIIIERKLLMFVTLLEEIFLTLNISVLIVNFVHYTFSEDKVIELLNVRTTRSSIRGVHNAGHRRS